MTMIALSLIRTDDEGTQSRAETNTDAIDAYRDSMESGAVFPPIVLFFDGKDYWIGDGFHRAWAAAAAGREDIEADIRPGTRRDAILYAAGANATHGLYRSNATKRRAVRNLLLDPEWSRWSDSKIAKHCAVGHNLVSKMRRELEASLLRVKIAPPRLVERNGTTYPMNTGAIGSGRRPDLPGQSTFLNDEGAGEAPDDEGEEDEDEQDDAASPTDVAAAAWGKILYDYSYLVNSIRRCGGIAVLAGQWRPDRITKAVEFLTEARAAMDSYLRDLKEMQR
jgi:hypothetical protein